MTSCLSLDAPRRARPPAGRPHWNLSIVKMSGWRPRILSPGCSDGVVGVAARVASVQVPWHNVDQSRSPGWDFSHHITALEAMLAEMELRVRKKQG